MWKESNQPRVKWNLDLIYFYITAPARYRDGREVRTKLILSGQFGIIIIPLFVWSEPSNQSLVEVLVEVVDLMSNILVNNEGEGREGPVNTTCSAVIYLVPTRRLWPGLGGPWYQLNTRPANWLVYVQNISEWTGTPWRELMTFMTALPSLQSRQCNILGRKNCSLQILWEYRASSRVTLWLAVWLWGPAWVLSV